MRNNIMNSVVDRTPKSVGHASVTSSSKRSLAYFHFGSRFEFPMSRSLFGQTFVMGNMTCATRLSDAPRKNYVYLRDDEKHPLNKKLVGPEAQKLVQEKFNSDLRIGYGIDNVGEVARTIEVLAREGVSSVLMFHFPIGYDAEFSIKLDQELRRRNIRDSAKLIYYLHCLPDAHSSSSSDGTELKSHLTTMQKYGDSVVSVSSAVREQFLALGLNSSTILNGVDPFIYNRKSDEEIDYSRRTIGLSTAVTKVVGYAGRIDTMKGSDYLLSAIDHFNRSTKKDDSGVGFVIATPHLLNMECAPKMMRKMLEMKRLIEEDRLKFVFDISKYTRADSRFRSSLEWMMGASNIANSVSPSRAYGGLIDIPVQAISDVYVHPSRSEALGLAIVEALYSGAYIISTNVGGIPEIVTPTASEHGIGKLLDVPTDVNGYKSFVSNLVSGIRAAVKPSLESMEGIKDLIPQYTTHTMYAQVERLVEGLFR